MKKVLFIFISVLLLPSCDKGSSGSSDTNYIVKPGELTAINSPVNTYNYTFLAARQGNAIIYNGVISGTNYVGLALGDNNNESFGLYIYFPSTTFPTSFPTTINNIQSISGAIIKARDGSTNTDYAYTSGTLNLTFKAKNEGTYVTYTITPATPDALVLGVQAVTFGGDITALFVGTNP